MRKHLKFNKILINIKKILNYYEFSIVKKNILEDELLLNHLSPLEVEVRRWTWNLSDNMLSMLEK